MSEDAGIKPRTVATSALTVRRSNHSTRYNQHSGDLIHIRLDLIHDPRLDLINTRLDIIHDSARSHQSVRLDLMHSSLKNCHRPRPYYCALNRYIQNNTCLLLTIFVKTRSFSFVVISLLSGFRPIYTLTLHTATFQAREQ